MVDDKLGNFSGTLKNRNRKNTEIEKSRTCSSPWRWNKSRLNGESVNDRERVYRRRQVAPARCIDECTNRWTDAWINALMEARMKGWTDAWMNAYVYE